MIDRSGRGDPRELVVHATLRNGTPLTIRAVRPDDRERIVRAFGELDRESVYTRFFTYRNALTDRELARIATMDFVDETMLVATIGSGSDETVIGSARYVAHDAKDGARSAEVAFVVEEDYQGQGIAGRLIDQLVVLARAAGIRRLVAEVLPGNKAMLAVFARAGWPVEQRIEDGVVHVTIDLSGR